MQEKENYIKKNIFFTSVIKTIFTVSLLSILMLLLLKILFFF